MKSLLSLAILLFYVLCKALGTHQAVAHVDDLRTARVVVIIATIGAVALDEYLAVVVKVEILCGFDIGFLLFEYPIFSLHFGLAYAVFVDAYYAGIAMAIGIVFTVVSCAFKPRHNFLLVIDMYTN